MKIGLMADSAGDIGALERAAALLLGQGAERLFFLGGRYPDVDELVNRMRAAKRGDRAYGDQDFLDDVASFLGRTEQGLAGRLLGGDDADKLREKFSRVPCRDSLEYRDPQVPKKLVEMVGDTLACLVHDKSDLTKDDMLNAVLLMHGKSPEANVVQIGPRFFITPGRLTGASEQTCATVEVSGGSLKLEAYTLDGASIKRLDLALAKRTKLSVS